MHKGMLEKRETFGLFISLEPGITGLLPKSKISYSSAEKLVGKLKEGDAIPVTIVAIDPRNRKITLSPGDSSDETEWKNYAKHSDISIGSLGEKLQAALKPKKNSRLISANVPRPGVSRASRSFFIF